MSKLLPILFCGMFCAAQIHAQATEISIGQTPDEEANETLDVLTTNARSLIGRSLQLTGTRVWVDSTGKHKMLAEFVKIDIAKNAVILKNSSGKEAAVLISKLGDDDQQVIEDILATRHELQVLLVLQNKILENLLQQRTEETEELAEKKKEDLSVASTQIAENALTTDDKPEFTVSQLKQSGSDRLLKMVAFKNCKFMGVHDNWLRTINMEAADKQLWLGFHFEDSEGEYFPYGLAFIPDVKGGTGKLLSKMSLGTKMNIAGIVTPRGQGKLGFTLTELEVSPDMATEEVTHANSQKTQMIGGKGKTPRTTLGKQVMKAFIEQGRIPEMTVAELKQSGTAHDKKIVTIKGCLFGSMNNSVLKGFSAGIANKLEEWIAVNFIGPNGRTIGIGTAEREIYGKFFDTCTANDRMNITGMLTVTSDGFLIVITSLEPLP